MHTIEEATIRGGHRALLRTLREFAAGLEADGIDGARGAAAFLRQTLLPFARREEAALPASAAAEAAALDHAFLAAEIDALAAEARALAACPGALDAVRRRLHRVEAVLELHLARDDEAPDAPEPWRAEPPAEQPPPGPGPREMDADEVRTFVAARDWGVLSTVGPDGVPYAVPVSYGWDGRGFVVATGPGRKLRHLQEHGAACLTIADVRDGGRWKCVVAAGPARAVADALGRVRALTVIARQRGAGGLSAADLARAARSRVFRIHAAELTGRVRG